MPDELNADATPEEDFYKLLRDSENQLEAEAKSMPQSETNDERAMIDHLSAIMMEMLSTVRKENEPDKVFAAAMQGLNKMQQEQFILENILESLKRGENLPEVMSRFNKLGLVKNQEDAAPVNIADNESAAPYSRQGSFFMNLGKKIGRSSMILTKLAWAAAKAAGKFVEVVPVIGFVGPVPSVSLQLKPKGASVDELIELVMEILE